MESNSFILLLISQMVLWFAIIRNRPKIWRWIACPWRKPDITTTDMVWFDELVLFDLERGSRWNLGVEQRTGRLYIKNRFAMMFDLHWLGPEVQSAYKEHLNKKFEEMILK